MGKRGKSAHTHRIFASGWNPNKDASGQVLGNGVVAADSDVPHAAQEIATALHFPVKYHMLLDTG